MKNEFTYLSKDGKTQIHAMEWIPEGSVRGILQIAHGMVEFIGRYDRFASFMARQGFYVAGNDHLGHGQSVTNESELGFFAEKDGNLCVIGDMHTLREKTEKTYPGIPYFLMGHSMGSFLVRQYIEDHGKGLAGAIVMGTGYQQAGTLNAGIMMTGLIGKVRGGHYRSRLVNNMALGSYNKAIKSPRTAADWLTKDEGIVDYYVGEPLCQFVFTVNGYRNLFRGLKYAQDPANLAKIPKDLPVLVVSGADDPVGEFGKGPKTVAEVYRQTGLKDVTLRLYPGDRHEVLNELDRETVDHDLLQWMEAHM